jgi:hypothetical protein
VNDNAKALYEDLANERLREFDMHHWCGSACCLGGNAYLRMIGRDEPVESIESHEEGDIAAWLGIDADIALQLFYPGDHEDEGHPWNGICESPYNATQQQAAEALKRACELSEAQ